MMTKMYKIIVSLISFVLSYFTRTSVANNLLVKYNNRNIKVVNISNYDSCSWYLHVCKSVVKSYINTCLLHMELDKKYRLQIVFSVILTSNDSVMMYSSVYDRLVSSNTLNSIEGWFIKQILDYVERYDGVLNRIEIIMWKL